MQCTYVTRDELLAVQAALAPDPKLTGPEWEAELRARYLELGHILNRRTFAEWDGVLPFVLGRLDARRSLTGWLRRLAGIWATPAAFVRHVRAFRKPRP